MNTVILMKNERGKTRKEKIDQHYEKQWSDYTEEDVFDRVRNLSKVLDPITSQLNIKPDEKVLDLGSGPAILPLRIAQVSDLESGIKIIGLEISYKAIQLGNRVIAKKGLGDFIHLVRGDAENLPFKNNSFNAVVSNATINLLLDKEKGFKEIVRVTKEGGNVVIGDCTAKEKGDCEKESDSNDRLWNVCIAGAPTKEEMKNYAEKVDLEVFEIIDLTDEVSFLVKNELWDWPEFIEYDLDYHVFRMKKSGN